MLSEVTSRSPIGEPPGVPPGGGAPRWLTRVGSSPVSDTDVDEEGGAISNDAPASPGEPSAAALVGDLPTERHRLPARVIRYWRWRAVYWSLPLVVLLIGLAIGLPWGPEWMRWGVVGAAIVVIAAGVIILPPIRYRVFWYAISSTEIGIAGCRSRVQAPLSAASIQTLRIRFPPSPANS